MRGAFGGHFSWQAHYLVTLDDVLLCPRVSFFETVVIFHAHHFRGRRETSAICRAELGEILTCARATVASLCAFQIALVVAQCPF